MSTGNKRAIYICFAAIMAVAFFLRTYNISVNPSGLQVDEASIAFNAYLVATTGSDESGQEWPLYPQSTWNPKHPVHFYVSVLSVSLFGLNETAARVPSIFFGLLAVAGVFLLGRELFGDRRIGLAASMFLAVSPWHTHFSRFGVEAVALPALFAFGLFFVLRGLKSNGALLLPGAFLLGLCFYAYPVALAFVPLFLAGFAVLYRKELLRLKGWTAAAAALLALMYLPMVLYFFPATGMNDYTAAASITSDDFHTSVTRHAADCDAPLCGLLENSGAARTAYGFVTNYAGYLGPGFLFSRGDTVSLKHGPRPFGMMHAACVVFMAAGLAAILLGRRRGHLLLLWWLAVFPVGGAMTGWAHQHAIRSIAALPGLQLICAAGLCAIAGAAARMSAGSRWARAAAAAVMVAALAANSVFFFQYYFRDYPVESSAEFNYGFRDAFRRMAGGRGEYDMLIVSDAIPYIYTYLFFYAPPSPGQISRHPDTGMIDVRATARNMGFEICDIRQCMESADPSGLVLARPMHLPEGIYKKKNGPGFFRLEKLETYAYGGGPASVSIARIDTLTTPVKTIGAAGKTRPQPDTHGGPHKKEPRPEGRGRE